MTDLSDRSAFEPRLPQDPTYWSALADRITGSADPLLAELRRREAWWAPLHRFGPALSVGALAAAVAVFVVLPIPEPTSPPVGSVPAAPTSLVDNAFLSPPAPDVVTLMILGTEESR